MLTLISYSYTEAEHRGEIDEQSLFDHQQGLIVLSGGVGGHLWQSVSNADLQTASATLALALDFADRYYLELTRTGRPNEEAFIAWAVEQSQQHAVAVVATNDVCFES